MIDLHCHLLPGVDDGPRDLETAVAMARQLHAVGFVTIAPSPHTGTGPGGDTLAATAAAARDHLADALRQHSVALDLVPNAEHTLSPALLDRVAAQTLVPIGGRGHWLLLELPWMELVELEGALERLQQAGYRILLAHPERYDFLSVELLRRLRARGVVLQADLGSLVGLFGPGCRERVNKLVRLGLIDVVASDLHEPVAAHDWLSESLRLVASALGADGFELVTEVNPRKILADAAVSEIVAPTVREEPTKRRS